MIRSLHCPGTSLLLILLSAFLLLSILMLILFMLSLILIVRLFVRCLSLVSQLFSMPCHSPIYVDNPTPWIGELKIPVPCGGCPVCQRNRITSWVFRLLQEEKRSIASNFVTLTYDDSNLPRTPNKLRTLRRRDLTLFWKRLRKKQSSKIKYYAVGEYGSKTQRPHYHAIVFNVEDTDFFADAWQLGHVDIGNVSDASIFYTASYINKSGLHIPEFRGDDRIREFSVMSRFLGSNYLSDPVIAYHRADPERNFVTLDGGCKVPLPKYYRDKIYSEAERETQRKIIEAKYVDLEYKKEEAFYRKYGEGSDWFQYLIEEKMGSVKTHIGKQKNRNL
ncbi:replication initiator protein [Microviridae sp.]|nr:replication initiator protein [Microviridae sp.]